MDLFLHSHLLGTSRVVGGMAERGRARERKQILRLCAFELEAPTNGFFEILFNRKRERKRTSICGVVCHVPDTTIRPSHIPANWILFVPMVCGYIDSCLVDEETEASLEG